MQRNEYINIILDHPYYSKKFNYCTEFVPFPSSFGVYLDKNQKWVFYEVDERERVDERVFNSESEAFDFAFGKYGLKIPAKEHSIKRDIPRARIIAPDGFTIIGGRNVAATRMYARTTHAHAFKKRTLASIKRKKKGRSVKKYSLKRKNSIDTN